MHVLAFVYVYFLAIAIASLAAQLDSESNLQCNETYAWSYDWVCHLSFFSCLPFISILFFWCQASNSAGKDAW